LGKTFEASHAGTKVTFNFAGSQTLAEQITQGAQVDAFASANEANMKTVIDAGLGAADPKIYATNTLEIAVPPDNPAKIASFADLAKKDVKVVVCAPAVPCGAATEKVEKATGITLAPVSEEQAVTDVMAKVQAGEADAGLVYKTDVMAAGDKVQGIPFTESKEAVNKNSIVGLKNGPQASLGQEFVDLVLSSDGQKVLADAGFGPAE
ncbi:MAG: molybdate ABC transporter substrate-binding protein, partial [Microlunatus sp.]